MLHGKGKWSAYMKANRHEMSKSVANRLSILTSIGYPSGREYVEVRTDLVAHAEELERMTKLTWKKYGLPLDR